MPLSAAVLLILANAAPAWAAEPLTLREAAELAARYSPGLLGAESRLIQAQSQIGQTKAGLYPQLSLSATGLNYRQLDANAISGFGGGGLGGASLSGLAPPGGSFNLMQTGLSLTQTLFDGFQTADALAMAEATLGMNEVERADQRRRAVYDAASAFFAVLRAERLGQNAEASRKQAEAHVAAAQVREKAGAGTRFEVLQAQTQLAAVEGQVRAAAHAVALARLAMGNVLGEEVGDRPLLGATLPAAGDPEVGAAAERRPEVQTLLWKRRLDQASVDLNKKANLPRATLGGSYSQQGFTSGRSLSVSAGLQWNLIDWGKADAKVVQAQKDLEQTDLKIVVVRQSLGADVQGAILGRHDAVDRLAIAGKGADLAREAYRMAELRYKAGIGTSYDVIDARTALLQAENAQAQAAFDVQAAEIRLAQAQGVDLVLPEEQGK